MLKVYLGMHNRHIAEPNRITRYISRIYVVSIRPLKKEF